MPYGYFVGCCSPVPAPVITPPAGGGGSSGATTPPVSPTYTFSTGVLNSSGTTYVFDSATQTINVANATTITFNGQMDDIGVLHTPASTIAASVTGSVETVVVPAGSILIAVNSGNFFTSNSFQVGDGTHSATIAAEASPSQATSALSAGGFTLITLGTPFPISTLAALGMVDGSNNLNFKWALIPAGGGQINITSCTLA